MANRELKRVAILKICNTLIPIVAFQTMQIGSGDVDGGIPDADRNVQVWLRVDRRCVWQIGLVDSDGGMPDADRL